MAPAATTTVKTIKRDIPFTWEGKDKRGNRVKGKSLAPDETVLRGELRRQGIAASRIRKQSAAVGRGGKVKPEDIAVFSRQLATMLAAGIPLVQAFEIVGNGNDKPAMQKLILDAAMPCRRSSPRRTVSSGARLLPFTRLPRLSLPSQVKGMSRLIVLTVVVAAGAMN